jgi:hypothetical protein
MSKPSEPARVCAPGGVAPNRSPFIQERERRAQIARTKIAFLKLVEDSKLSALALLFVRWLADFCAFKEHHAVWMARSKMAQKLHVSVSTLDRITSELEDGGWISCWTVYAFQLLPNGKQANKACKVYRPLFDRVLAAAHRAAPRERHPDDLDVLTETAEVPQIPASGDRPLDPLRIVNLKEDHTQGSGAPPVPPAAPSPSVTVPANDTTTPRAEPPAGVCGGDDNGTNQLEELINRWRIVDPDRRLDQGERAMLVERLADCGAELVADAIEGAAHDTWIRDQARDRFRAVFIRAAQVTVFAERARKARAAAAKEHEAAERARAHEVEEMRKEREFASAMRGPVARPARVVPPVVEPAAPEPARERTQNDQSSEGVGTSAATTDSSTPPVMFDATTALDQALGGTDWRGPSPERKPRRLEEVPHELTQARQKAAALWAFATQNYGEDSEEAGAALAQYEAAKRRIEAWREGGGASVPSALDVQATGRLVV